MTELRGGGDRDNRRGPARARTVVLIVFGTFLVLLLGAGGLGVWAYSRLRASLPVLDGTVAVSGLSGPVTVTRDALGVPTVEAGSRRDAALATGFLHAQDRFFQMDLLRRRAAGELAELFGPAALRFDRRYRRHRFRVLAREIWARTGVPERGIVEAYCEGVNRGLEELGSKPFEYHILRAAVRPWKPEDTLLTIFAMYFQLNDDLGSRESAYGVLHDVLPGELARFLGPRGTEWDAPLIGPPFATPSIPGPDVFDLRDFDLRDLGTTGLAKPGEEFRTPSRAAGASRTHEEEAIHGSNCWAVSGELTSHGDAILANDMHLALQVPHVWYRMALRWAPGDEGVTGVTLPGTPAVVVGSNGRVAWGLTNSFGDWSDLVILETRPDDASTYRTPDGWETLRTFDEILLVHGAAPETLSVAWSRWGPVIDEDHLGRPRALHWIAHEPDGANLNLLRLEGAAAVGEAIDIVRASGIPPQNVICCDADGNIGWTIGGHVPRRLGFDGRTPSSWASGTHRWDGWTDPEDVPAIVNPAGGKLWTANNRTVDGDALARLGDGGYDLGARARQIRDALADPPAAGFAEQDLFTIQLDDRALFLQRWRDLLLRTLRDTTGGAPYADSVGAGGRARADSLRREARRLVETGWTGRATADNVAFRLVRSFRLELRDQIFGPLLDAIHARAPAFDASRVRHREGPLWRIATQEPEHWLLPPFATWQEQRLAAMDSVLSRLSADGLPLETKTWGDANRLEMRHPLSYAIPSLSRWLDMPPDPLPGDENMPRVQRRDHGASMRMVVSPGHEERGILHMPGGQSGHPLSPFYRAGHRAWVEGRPLPFLPGPARHRLVLEPVH